MITVSLSEVWVIKLSLLCKFPNPALESVLHMHQLFESFHFYSCLLFMNLEDTHIYNYF